MGTAIAGTGIQTSTVIANNRLDRTVKNDA
jgi:hypothetical protein